MILTMAFITDGNKFIYNNLAFITKSSEAFEKNDNTVQ